MTTSRVGRKTRDPASDRRRVSPARTPSAKAPPRPRAGFTLLEILLAVALVGMIAGMVVINLTGWYDSEKLIQGAERMETALRLARADAANLGRRLRLEFEEETGDCMIMWEPKPLEEPGEFTDYAKVSTWTGQMPNELVRVNLCRLTGPSAYRTLNLEATPMADSDAPELEAITFYPDGSCDSAIIELSGTVESETRRVVIELDGANGTIRRHVFYDDEGLEEYYEQLYEEQLPVAMNE